MSELAVSICGIRLRNPVIAASGTFAYGVEFAGQVEWKEIGGLVVKGLSREPIEGNPAPRVYETEAGMINSIGLQNIGVRAFVKEKLPALARLDTAVFANVFGCSIEDYVEVVRVLNDHEGVAGYELNVSCPNTAHGGIYFSSDPGLLARSGGGGEAGGAASGDRQALAERERDRAVGAGGAGERSGRDLADQYADRAGDRCAHASGRGSARGSAGCPGRRSSRWRCASSARRRGR